MWFPSLRTWPVSYDSVVAAVKAYADKNLDASDGKMAGSIVLDEAGDPVIGKVIDFKYDYQATTVSVVAKIVDDRVKAAIKDGGLTATSFAIGRASCRERV